MGLKQISQEKRILFLRKFTIEIIKTFLSEDETRHRVEIERIKHKLIKPQINLQGMQPKANVRFDILEYTPSIISKKEQEQSINPLVRLDKISSQEETNKEKNMYTMRIPIEKQMRQIRRFIPQREIEIAKTPVRAQLLNQISPEVQARPADFFLESIEYLLRDITVQSIECLGPGEKLLVKRYNQTYTTKSVLNQEQINNIINRFSNEARIPIVGGLLKAAVGDLIISAIISKFVGSRFIINRITPYSQI